MTRVGNDTRSQLDLVSVLSRHREWLTHAYLPVWQCHETCTSMQVLDLMWLCGWYMRINSRDLTHEFICVSLCSCINLTDESVWSCCENRHAHYTIFWLLSQEYISDGRVRMIFRRHRHDNYCYRARLTRNAWKRILEWSFMNGSDKMIMGVGVRTLYAGLICSNFIVSCWSWNRVTSSRVISQATMMQGWLSTDNQVYYDKTSSNHSKPK